MSNGYKFIGGISKDFDSNKNLETYFGFGYENCCLAFRLYASDKRLSKYNFLNFQTGHFHDTRWDKMIEIENKSASRPLAAIDTFRPRFSSMVRAII